MTRIDDPRNGSLIKGRKVCPSTRELIGFFEDVAAAGKKRRVLDHVLSCPECHAVFLAAEEVWSKSDEILRSLEGFEFKKEALKRLRDEARREVRLLRKTRRLKRAASLRRLRVPAAGAALGLLIVTSIIVSLRTHRPVDVERRTSPLEIALLQPKGTVRAPALSFKWTAHSEVQSYRLEVYDRGLELVFETAPLASAEYTLPEGNFNTIEAGEVYFWKIIATFNDNQSIESDFARFIVQK